MKNFWEEEKEQLNLSSLQASRGLFFAISIFDAMALETDQLIPSLF